MFARSCCLHIGPVIVPVVRRLYPCFPRLESCVRTFRISSHLRILGSSGEHDAWHNEEMLIAAGLLTKTVEPVLGAMKPKAELSHYRRFALLPSSAQTFVEKLGIDFSKDRTLIADCCPGGVVTHALEEVGADKVVALQKFKQDVIAFKGIQADHPCLRHILHCDFFKMDLQLFESRPPFLMADELFEQLGLQVGSWNGVIPLRVLAFLPISTARQLLWRQIFHIFHRTSIYQLGRVELNVIMNEQLYQKLSADVGSKDYRCFAVLWQESCHITLLHMEPKSSFLCKKETRSLKNKKYPNMCFVRLTPRKDLFTVNMEPALVDLFCSMVYQCLALPNRKLIDNLNLWSLGRGCEIMTAAGLDPDMKSREISPLSYRHLFLTLIEHQDAIMVSKEMLMKSLSKQN